MTSQELLSEIFEVLFKRGKYLHQLETLNAEGKIDKWKQFLVTIKTLEMIDDLQDRVTALENKKNAKGT